MVKLKAGVKYVLAVIAVLIAACQSGERTDSTNGNLNEAFEIQDTLLNVPNDSFSAENDSVIQEKFNAKSWVENP